MHLLVHTGGLPIAALAALFGDLGGIGRPTPCFDHDGPMFENLLASDASDLESYLDRLMQEAERAGQPFSAMVDCSDLKWLEPKAAFRRWLERSDVRVIRIRSRDLVLQAVRLAGARSEGALRSPPNYAEIADAVVRIEMDEAFADRWSSRHAPTALAIWLDDLYEPGLPKLGHLFSDDARRACTPLAPPDARAVTIAEAFRVEAAGRHWSHALVPPASASSPASVSRHPV